MEEIIKLKKEIEKRIRPIEKIKSMEEAMAMTAITIQNQYYQQFIGELNKILDKKK